MKKNFLIALVSLLVFTACGKDPDEMIVTIKESGFVKIKVVDNDNQPLKGAEVQISNAEIIWEGITDDSGVYAPEKMLQSSYYCTVSFTKQGVEYQEIREIQVIAGETRTITVNPFANSGNVNIQLKSNDGRLLPDLNVLILPQNFQGGTFDEYIAAANFKGKVDSQKKISFVEIPVGNYRIWIYDDDKTLLSTNSYISIARGKTIEHTIIVYFYSW